MFHLPFHVSVIRFSLIQERMLRHFSSLFFRIQKKRNFFFSLKPPSSISLSPVFPRAPASNGPSLFHEAYCTKDTVICFTYFLISFFFSHLVILPSFSRRKLKWKEKVEPMFYTNSSCESSSTFRVLQPVCQYYRRTNFFVWCSYYCSLFGSSMWTCVIKRSDPPFLNPRYRKDKRHSYVFSNTRFQG